MRFYLAFFMIIGLFVPSAHAEELAQTDPTTATTPVNQVVINEIYPNPVTGAKEWVEIFNVGDTSVDLEGWRLCDNRQTNCTIAKLTSTLDPEQWLLITLSSSYLNNDGDSAILYDSTDAVVDRLDYGTTLLAPIKGAALARATDGDDHDRPSDWSPTADPTPGYANYITPEDQPIGAIIYSPPLKPAPPEPKPTAVAAPIAKITTPPPIHWKVTLPTVVITHTTATLQAKETADTRGGIIFYSWKIGSSTYEGEIIKHLFPTSGLWPIIITASSTSGSTSTYRGSLWVAAPTTTPIHITEIYPDNENFSEFIELYNDGTSTVDISAWRIMLDNGNQFIIPPSTTLVSGAYAVFSKTATGLSLSNTGTTIYLLSSSTTLADSVVYEKIINDKSYQLINGGWSWQEPSPGTPPLPFSPEEESPENTVKIAAFNEKTPMATTKQTIAVARELPTKTRVVVNGQVASLPGQFGSQFWYLVDSTGGLQIFRQNKNFPPLALGQWVQVTGVLSSFNSIPRLKAEQIETQGSTNLNHATATIAVVAEQLGQLVTIHGEITKRTKTQLYIDDDEEELLVVIKKGTNISTNDLELGDKVDVTGIIEQTSRSLELWPRQSEDIIVTQKSKPPATLKQSPTSKNFILPTGALLAIAAFIIYKKTPIKRVK